MDQDGNGFVTHIPFVMFCLSTTETAPAGLLVMCTQYDIDSTQAGLRALVRYDALRLHPCIEVQRARTLSEDRDSIFFCRR